MRVSVEEVGFSFHQRQILSGFTAVFAENVVTALVGPSGSGKSTLMAAIAGYTRPQSGHIWFDDASTRHPPASTDVSWIAQDANVLAPRTAWENVMIGPLSDGVPFKAARARSASALDDVGLGPLRNRLCRTMSGGEKQRVAVARSLASRRPLILADEPSAGLDEENTERLAEIFATIRTRATVIIATHDPVMMRAASTTVQLRGRPS